MFAGAVGDVLDLASELLAGAVKQLVYLNRPVERATTEESGLIRGQGQAWEMPLRRPDGQRALGRRLWSGLVQLPDADRALRARRVEAPLAPREHNVDDPVLVTFECFLDAT